MAGSLARRSVVTVPVLVAVLLIAAVPAAPVRAETAGTADNTAPGYTIFPSRRPAIPDNTSGPGARPAAAPSPRGIAGEKLPSDEELAAGGAVIGEIIIRNENIFDLSDPKENNWVYRTANTLHAKTRPWLIRNQLLFRTGDRYDRKVLDESERILRSDGYFYDAAIRPVAYRDGRVDVEVATHDVWTLRPGVSFKRQGGANTTSIDFSDKNLLGTGTSVGVAHSSNPDRSSNSVSLESSHIAGSWYRGALLYSENSDGRKKSVVLERPFYALDTRWAAGATYIDDVRVDGLFGRAGVVRRFRTRAEQRMAWAGWSPGLSGGWTRRYTIGYTRDASRFETAPDDNTAGLLPPDRILAYPWVAAELVEDAYEKTRNRDQIMRTEDFYLGTRLRGQLGYSTHSFGANREAVVFNGQFGTSLQPARFSDIFLEGTADGRVGSGKLRDTTLAGNGRLYVRVTESWLVYSLLSGSRGYDLDFNHELVLGGENGLRGYPRRYQAGDRTALFTAEVRYFNTTFYPFRLARIGAAAFYDMGRAWGGSFVKAQDPGVLRNVGVGIRVGLTRSGLGNVIHLDAAFPLDGDPTISRVQFLVSTKKSF